MFINLVKKSFADIVKNPVITLFLVLYFIIISLLLGALNIQRNFIMVLVLFCTSLLFVAIFISGWLRIIKEIAVKSPDEEREKTYVAMFFESAGENIVPTFMGILLYIVFGIISMLCAFFVAMAVFGNPQILIPDIQNASSILDLSNLSPEKLKILFGWQLCFSGFACVFTFLFMYYFPAIIFNRKSNLFLKSFVALKDNFYFLFKQFLGSFLIFITLFLINTAIGAMKGLCFYYFKSHSTFLLILDVLYILYVIYFLSFSVMLICNYYAKLYSCDNGGDCLGENISDNQAGEEN